MNEKETVNNNEQVEIGIDKSHERQNDENNYEAPLSLKKTKKEYTIFPLWLAIIVLIINIILPGIGTFIATAKVTDRTYISFYCFSGLCQFLTFICIIGWVFALIHSITFISAACAGKSIEDYLVFVDNKKNPIKQLSEKEGNVDQQEQII